jgi:tetratricopeptide (TPR) repeat protein
MSEPHAGRVPSPLSVVEAVDAVCDRFEAAWKAGQRPRLEDYLAAVPESRRLALLRELLLLEVHHRRRLGETPRLDDYWTRFPTLDSEWVRGMLDDNRTRIVTPPDPERVRDMVAAGGEQAGGAPRPPPPPLPLSFASGRYQVRRFLGEGGMKRVYLAHDTHLDRQVALSLIKVEKLDAPGLARVRREARAMGRLGDHPHIVTIYDTAEEDGQPYLVSQYMEGGSVDDLLRRAEQRRLPLEEVLRIADEVCQALEYAHQRHIIHRDLKPMNVWLTQTGTVKLGDFGLAVALDQSRLTAEGMMLGTVAYMPPEQALGRTPQARSDLYSLGIMLYEMVAGRLPFRADDYVAVIYQHINTPPVAPTCHNPEVPRALESLILRLLAKDPEDRPKSAAAVRKALRAVAAQAPPHAPEAVGEPVNPLDRLAGGIFVGREREMRELRAGLEDAVAGRGRLLLLVGEPGVGKTRTAEELITYARVRGVQALVGRCYEEEGAPPYWPWVQIIRSYVQDCDPAQLRAEMSEGAPDIAQVVSGIRERLPGLPAPQPLEGEQARFRLFDSITTFLIKAGQGQPLVLILEDLHWADKPSLLLLQFLTRELKHSRLFVVGTYRDIELGRQHPLAQTLGELAREQLSQRILLRGLGEQDVARFLEISLGLAPPPALAAAVYRETEGNPFFVTEVVRLLLSDGRLQHPEGMAAWTLTIPQGVREVIGRRLDRLSPECNRVLTVAAAVGREFGLNVLERVSDLSGDRLLETLEETLAARVVIEVPRAVGRYSFAHALIREVLYDELSTSRRVRLHRRIGDVLERLYATNPEPHLAELAHHFYQAAPGGDVEKALAYAVRAGEWAVKRLAYEEAASQYERALQILELREPEEGRRALLADLHAKRGAAFANAGMWVEARSELEAALEGLAPEGRAQRAETLVDLAMACYWLLDVSSMHRHATEALALAEEAGRVDLAAKALSWLAEAQKSDGELLRTLDLFGRVIGQAGEHYPLPLALVALPLFWLGRFDEAIARSREGIQAARGRNDISTLVLGLPHLGLALAAKGQYDEAARVFEEARLLGRKYGIRTLLARSISMSAGFHLDVFDFAGAEALAEEACEMGRSLNFQPPLVSASLDLLLNFTRRHEVGRTEKLVDQVAEGVAKTSGWHRWQWEGRLAHARAEIALARGHGEEAVRRADEVIAQSQAMGRVKYHATGLKTRGEALASLGRTKEGIADLRQAVTLARGIADPALFLHAATVLLGLEGDDTLAGEARQAAVRIAGALPDADMRRRFEAADPVRLLS